MTVVAEARRLAQGGWNSAEIVERLSKRGIPVSQRSVVRWTNPRVAERDRRRDLADRRRDAAASTGRLGSSRATPEFKLARMRALRDRAELKDPQIARLMGLDFGDVMSRDMVAHALARGEYPRSLR